MSHHVFAPLAGWQCIDLTGPDAQDFLNRLSSADFRRLAPGQFTPGTLLLPTGKIQLYFKAIELEPAHYLILVPPAQPNAPASQAGFDAFERMHFRENLKLEAQGDRFTYLRILAADEKTVRDLGARLPAFAQAAGAPVGTVATGAEGIFLHEAKWCAAPIVFDIGAVVSQDQLQALLATLAAAGFESRTELESFRIRAGDPAVPAELGHSTIPLEANLGDAIHENKGCYPGQEVIERIRSMGQVPRKLALLRGTGKMPVAGAAIHADGQNAGTVTSVATDPIQGGWVALGFIKRVFTKDATSYSIADQTASVTFKG